MSTPTLELGAAGVDRARVRARRGCTSTQSTPNRSEPRLATRQSATGLMDNLLTLGTLRRGRRFIQGSSSHQFRRSGHRITARVSSGRMVP
jgi:hypothetical protein